MEPTVFLPFASSLLSFVFALFLLDQWRERRKPYQLIWTLGMLMYGVSAGTEFVGGAVGWSEPLYRAWYLTGAVWVAGWLGLGTMYLLAKTRFGYGAALSVVLAGLFTFLSWRKNDYPDSGMSPYLYLLIAVVAAIAIGVETYRAKGRWANLAGGLIVAAAAIHFSIAVGETALWVTLVAWAASLLVNRERPEVPPWFWPLPWMNSSVRLTTANTPP